MTVESIFQMAAKSTASGRGASYYDVAQNCGEKRYLSDLHTKMAKEGEQFLSQKQMGTYVHGLMHMRHLGSVPDGTVIDVGAIQDAEMGDALKIFNFMQEYFPESYFGTCAASEYAIPAGPAHEAFYGHNEISGQLDRLQLLNESDVLRFREDFNLVLPGPGLYILDWKTAGARASERDAAFKYTNTVQSKVYPLQWNLLGGEPCLGMIFFVLVNHANMRRHDETKQKLASVQAFFAPHSTTRDLEARAAVNFARFMRDNRMKNPYACTPYGGEECVFRTNNLCCGY